MKNSKKITSSILTLTVLLTVLLFTGITSFAATSGDFEYTVLSDGTAEINRYSGYNGEPASLTIPSKINGYTVSSIADWAFYGCGSLKITIPSSVTNISSYAFYCSGSEYVVDSGNKNYCSQDGVLFNKDKTELIAYPITSERTSYTIPNGVTIISDYAFEEARSLTSVTLPSTLKNIGSGAFTYCTNITSITIPNGVTSIGDFAFFACSSITSFTVPKSVTNIGEGAFIGEFSSLTAINVDSANKYYSSQDGVLFNKDKTELLEYPTGNGRTSYIVPNGVTGIGDSAFAWSRLRSVTVPSGVTSIGRAAFFDSFLTSITLPDSLTNIGDMAFGLSSLKNITIPNSVKSIGSNAFVDCASLTCVTIPNSVTSINGSVFGNCSSLTEVTIPNSVTSIEWGAFRGCYNLKDVYYGGTKEQWKKIGIAEENDDLLNAAIHYNYIIQVATPKLSSVSNVVAGVKVTWGKVSGAEKYRVFYKTGSGSWTKAGDTTSTSYTWTGAKNNTKYSFTVRCIDKDGKNYTSAYDTTGKSITFMSAPTVSVSNVVAGVKVSWGKVSGASNYAIFRKTPDGSYKKIGTATGTSYTDTTAKNNTKYVYAVRCATKDGNTYISSYNAGKSITFMSAPTVSVSNVVAGVKVSWGKVTGAVNYKVYRKTPNGSYKALGTTTSTSFVDKTAKNNTKYIYAVRCVTKDGKTTTSSYNAGKSKTFMSAPTFTVSNVVAGVKISWNKVSGASNYAVFRKTPNGSYKKIGTTTGTSYVDKTAKSGTKYIYTVRCASKDGKTYTSSYNAGKSKTFVSAPSFTVAKTSTGVQIKWSKVTGASNYAIFRKTANGSYKKIGTTTGTSFVDKTAKKGTKYIYTVRCASKDGKTYTSSYNAGKSITR